MSHIKVKEVAYARMKAPDLDLMEKFLVDFGLSRAWRTPDALYMRATGDSAYVHITERGDARFVGMAFHAESVDDLNTLSRLQGASPIEPLQGPGGGHRVVLTDPNGYQVEVVHGIAKVPEIEVASHAINAGSARYARSGALTRLCAGPSRVKRIGHVVMATPRLSETLRWYQETLGLLPSDEVFADSEDNIVGSFNRCDRGDEYVDHHAVLFFSGDTAGLNHVAFEVNDIDDVFLGHEHLHAAGGYEHMYGVGRHLLGSQVFDYWADPWGRVHEHWTDTDRLNAASPTNRMDIREGFVSQWGGEPPEKLLVRVSP